MKSHVDLSGCLLTMGLKNLRSRCLGRMLMMIMELDVVTFRRYNPRSLTKHLPALVASRNVPLISVKDRKQVSLRLGELIKVKTAIAVGIKAKGNSINRLIEEALSTRLTTLKMKHNMSRVYSSIS